MDITEQMRKDALDFQRFKIPDDGFVYCWRNKWNKDNPDAEFTGTVVGDLYLCRRSKEKDFEVRLEQERQRLFETDKQAREIHGSVEFITTDDFFKKLRRPSKKVLLMTNKIKERYRRYCDYCIDLYIERSIEAEEEK